MAKERKYRNINLRRRAQKPTTAAERVVWLLAHVWADNRTAMARDCACSHTVLIKIANGDRQPGRDLLERIAQHPKINPAWLFSGEGEPLVAEKQESTDGWPLKISTTPLPGPLEDHVGLLTAKSLAVSGAVYSPSRYVYQVAPNEPLVQDRDVAVLAGDLLIIESDPTVWQRNLFALDDKVCAVRFGVGEDESVMLAVVDAHPTKQNRSVKLSTRPLDASRRAKPKTPVARVKANRPRPVGHQSQSLNKEDVTGMVIQLIREM